MSAVGVDCNTDDLVINVLTYTDDIVLVAASWKALQQLLSVVKLHIADADMICDTNAPDSGHNYAGKIVDYAGKWKWKRTNYTANLKLSFSLYHKNLV